MRPAGSTLEAVTLAAVLTSAAGGSIASAQGETQDAKSDQFVTRLFAGPLGKTKSYACFVREYDAAHLARHKLQKVSAMKLLVTAERVPEDEALNYSFRLGVKFRHRPGNFDSSGECGHADAAVESPDRASIKCSVDCDGGGIAIGLTADDRSTMVSLERVRIWRHNKDASLEADADDRVFRLDRVSLKDCMSLVTERKELAALRRK
jgi:hypothetical protein